MITNADVTLYNRWYDRSIRDDRWLRTQITGVCWYGGQAVTVSDNGLLTASSYTVRIPLESAPTARRYAGPGEYANATAEAQDGLWTLQAGDIVVRGLVDDMAPPKASDKAPHFVITAVNDNRRGGLPHWKVTGK